LNEWGSEEDLLPGFGRMMPFAVLREEGWWLVMRRGERKERIMSRLIQWMYFQVPLMILSVPGVELLEHCLRA